MFFYGNAVDRQENWQQHILTNMVHIYYGNCARILAVMLQIYHTA